MAVVAIVAGFSLVQAFRPSDEAPAAAVLTAALPTTVIAPVVPTVTESPIVVTTGVPPPATTLPQTTSTSSTTSTTSTTTTMPPLIEPLGDPIPVESLALSVNGLGPLQLGDPTDGVLGLLAASLGQPDLDSGRVSGGAHGTCDEGTFRVVRWGALTVVNRVEDDTETFDSFRVDLRQANVAGPAAQLQTVSGIRVGATIGEFEDTYLPGFNIAYTTHPVEGDIYELRGASGLLLWGPITSSEADGIVQGIFSPETC